MSELEHDGMPDDLPLVAPPPTIRVYCDAPAHHGHGWTLGTYAMQIMAAGSHFWVERPRTHPRTRKDLSAAIERTVGGWDDVDKLITAPPPGSPTEGGRWQRPLTEHWLTAAGGRVDDSRHLWEARTWGYITTSTARVPVNVDGYHVAYGWRCKCGAEPIAATEHDVWPIFSGLAARGADRVSLAQLGKWLPPRRVS